MIVQGFLAWGIWAWVLIVVGWLVLCGLVTVIIVGIYRLRELIKELRDAKAEEDARPERSAPRANLTSGQATKTPAIGSWTTPTARRCPSTRR